MSYDSSTRSHDYINATGEKETKNPWYVATTRRGGDHYPCPSNNSWRPSICIIIIIFLPLPPPFVRPKVGCVLLWGWWCSSRGIRSQDGVQQQQHSISLGWNRFARFRLSIAGRGFRRWCFASLLPLISHEWFALGRCEARKQHDWVTNYGVTNENPNP